jgi:putative endonuclease
MPFPLLIQRLLPFWRRSEILGIEFLRSNGFRIAASGFRAKGGEVDIVAWDSDVLVFVEVKSLRSGSPPEDAVGPRKQRRVIRAAQTYISRHNLHSAPCRFDILAVTALPGSRPEFRLLRDAFRMYN